MCRAAGAAFPCTLGPAAATQGVLPTRRSPAGRLMTTQPRRDWQAATLPTTAGFDAPDSLVCASPRSGASNPAVVGRVAACQSRLGWVGINLPAGDLLVGSTPCVAAVGPKVCSNAPAAARHTSSAFSAAKREARGSTAHQSTCRGSGGGTKKRALRSAAEVAGPPVELWLRVALCVERPLRRRRISSRSSRPYDNPSYATPPAKELASTHWHRQVVAKVD